MIESNFNFDSINWPTEEYYWVVLDAKGREISEYFTYEYQAKHHAKYVRAGKVVRRKLVY